MDQWRSDYRPIEYLEFSCNQTIAVYMNGEKHHQTPATNHSQKPPAIYHQPSSNPNLKSVSGWARGAWNGKSEHWKKQPQTTHSQGDVGRIKQPAKHTQQAPSTSDSHQPPGHLAWTGVNSEWVGKGSPVTKGEWFHGLGRLRDKLPLGHLCH